MGLLSEVTTGKVEGREVFAESRVPSTGASYYAAICTLLDPADLIDPTKSVSVFIEVWSDKLQDWECAGGAHWGGGTAIRPADDYFALDRSGARDARTGETIDLFKGRRMRLRIESPAIDYDSGKLIWEECPTGGVSVRAVLADER